MVFLIAWAGTLQAQWQKAVMTDMQGYTFYASSELNAPADRVTGKYCPLNLFDRDPATAWVEGVAGQGVGEYVITGPLNEVPGKVFIDNGFQKSVALYRANNRLRAAILTLMVGINIPGHETEIGPEMYLLPVPGNRTLHFTDSIMTSVFETGWSRDMAEAFKNTAVRQFKDRYTGEIEGAGDKPDVHYYLRLEIKCVYPGTKWDDTCISGFLAEDVKPGHDSLAPEEKILNIAESEDRRKILITTNRRENLVLADAAEIEAEEQIPEDQRGYLALTLIDSSPDKEWVQIDVLYGHPGAGRSEEVARLYNTHLMHAVDQSLIGEDIYSMYGFEVKDGKTYLDTDAGMIDLEEVYRKLQASESEK